MKFNYRCLRNMFYKIYPKLYHIMQISEIKISLINETKKFPNSKYLYLILNQIHMLSYFHDIIKNINLSTTPEIIEAIRIYLVDHLNDFNYYIMDRKMMKSVNSKILMTRSYHEYYLNNNDIYKILSQIDAIQQDGILKDICNDNKKKENIYNIFFVVTAKKNEIDASNFIRKITHKYSINLLMGIETIKMIKHQNINRVCNYYKSSDDFINNSLNTFEEYYIFFKNTNENITRNIILISGTILHTLGTTYTSDIDMIYLSPDDDPNNNESIIKILTSKNFIDFHLIYGDTVIKKDNQQMTYMYQWLYRNWPNLAGANDLDEVIHNPVYHYYYMGMKFVSVDMTIKRIISRSSATGYVDLYALKKYNNYNINICIPNISLRQGNVMVYDDSNLKKTIKRIKIYFQEWHREKISINELKNKIKRCANTSPFIIHPITNQIAINAENYVHDTIKTTQNKYTSNIIIDADFAINNITDIINIFGSIDDVDTVIMLNSLKYILPDLDNVLSILQKKSNIHRIFFTYFDYDAFTNDENTKYEVFQEDELVYGVYIFHQENNKSYNKIIVYYKGVYDQHQGSLEYAISMKKCLKIFEKYGFKKIYDQTIINNNNMENPDIEYKILKYQKLAGFQKIF